MEFATEAGKINPMPKAAQIVCFQAVLSTARLAMLDRRQPP
jgi:hypothetical protein